MEMSYFCSAIFICAGVETDIVRDRTARWQKDSQRKLGKPASQPAGRPGNSWHRTGPAKVHKYSSAGQPRDRLLNIRNIKDNQYDLCCCVACYHCLATSGTMISAHSNHAMFLYYIDRAKLVDSQTVFVFSVGGLDSSQIQLIEIGRILDL